MPTGHPRSSHGATRRHLAILSTYPPKLCGLATFAAALERSRTDDVGVTNLYLLSGTIAPTRVRNTMWGCLGAQIVVAIAGATIGVVGLDEGRLNALAFGILVPMFGIGADGLWASRHGTYEPRRVAAERPNNRKIG